MISEAEWLLKVAEEIRKEGHAGWGNTCESSAYWIESAQAELTELRAIVERLREPVSDEVNQIALDAFCKQSIAWEEDDEDALIRAALTAYNKHILGE